MLLDKAETLLAKNKNPPPTRSLSEELKRSKMKNHLMSRRNSLAHNVKGAEKHHADALVAARHALRLPESTQSRGYASFESSQFSI
mmetsp:Transcript_13661/g.21343  ORF Transcript_13661/g.21343 Transcript_13661/m.21343 type:complete len:86 (-) Transcript_13661:665-922(-)